MSKKNFVYQVILICAFLTVTAACIFLFNPWIDLIVARGFHDPETGFLLNNYPFIGILRKASMFAYGIFYVLIVVFLIDSLAKPERPLWKNSGFEFPQWSYLVATSLIGPLLVVNVILKDNWGRARPRQLQEFGGNLDFSAPFYMSNQCQSNCSFVSGEPSSMFMIFISLAFVVSPAKRILLIGVGIVMGSFSGLMRMGYGGHFLSDVVFSGLFMAMIAAIVYWVMFISTWTKNGYPLLGGKREKVKDCTTTEHQE